MIRKSLSLLALCVVSSVAFAGDDCHISDVTPIVTDWTISGDNGRITITAKLAIRNSVYPYPPSEFYHEAYDARWTHTLIVHPVGTTDAVVLDTRHATVTDSTYHLEIPYQAGTYVYDVYIDGNTDGEAQLCPNAYDFHDTLTVVEGKTPTVRASLGQLRARWGGR